MEELFSRSELIYGQEAMEKLANSHVAIFGVGGVGGYVAESLARTGVGKLTLIDNDTVNLSNFNRQIVATKEGLGKYKVDVMKERILSINDKSIVEVKRMFVLPENIDEIDFNQFDYIVDAIDTVKAKLAIIKKANELNIPIISSMGAGNKLNPMGFVVADISKTEYDPLAKKIRLELRKLGIKKLKLVFSKERPVELKEQQFNENKKPIPGSNAFVPSACGLLIGSEVINDLIK